MIAVLALVMGSSLAAAAPSPQLPGAAVAWCVDPSVDDSIDVAARCAFGPEPRATERMRAQRLWARVTLPAGGDPAQRWQLHVGPQSVPALHAFFAEAGQWRKVSVGHRLPTPVAYLEPLGYRFDVPAGAGATEVYLRIDAPLPPALWVEAAPVGAPDGGRDLLLGLHLGLLTCLWVLALVAAVVDRGPVTWWFAALMGVVVLNVTSASGLLAMAGLGLWPEWNERLLYLLVMGRLSLWLAVVQALLRGQALPAWTAPACRATHAGVALAAVLVLFGIVLPAQGVMVGGPLILSSVLGVAVWRTPDMARHLRLALLADFGLLLVNLTMIVLATQFNPPGMKLPLAATRLTDLGNALAMLVLVIVGNRVSRQDLESARLSLAQTRLQVQYERRLQEQRDTVAHMLGHELKNALGTIRLAARNLLPDLPPGAASAQRRLAHIDLSAQTMSAILERGLLGGAVTAGGSTDPGQSTWIRAVPTDLGELLHSLVAQEGDAERVRVYASPGRLVVTDPQLLGLIFSSLLHNSLRYSPPHSPVEVQVDTVETADGSAPQVRVIFRNRVAVGIVLDETAILFRRYRHPSHQTSEGSGLGLALARKLSALLGGTLRFRQRGLVVLFSLEIPQ